MYVPLTLPEGIPATDEEEETRLLRRLQQNPSGVELSDSLYELACYYNKNRRSDLATKVMMTLMDHSEGPEEQAFCYMTLGQIAEQNGQSALAVQHYTQGLRLQPKAILVAYYLHNNMACCLNAERRYRDGEWYSRAAIEIDSGRANAFKNLGISLQGQGDIIGAAWAYAEASRADPSDAKTLRLLRRTVAEEPKVLTPLVHTLFHSSTAVN
jgi:tetratricopeptide (TPR) repeat protein